MPSSIGHALTLCQTRLEQATPGCLAEAARSLGGLATWWLRPQALRTIERLLACRFAIPRPPSTRGTCVLLFAQRPAGRWPLLRSALPLPLAWQERRALSNRLPAKLTALADAITRQLGLQDWSLHLHPDLSGEGLDLRPLDELIEVESAWAPLAAGLLVAADGGRPDPTVWSTGAWSDEDGVRTVELEAKLELAADFGVRRFFVPASQKDEAERRARRSALRLSIGALTTGAPHPRKALRGLLAELDVPPSRDEPPETRAAWYLRQPDEDRARRYYRENLLPDVAARLRRQWQQAVGLRCTHLVTIASDNPELAWLAVYMTQAEQCLVLYTQDKQDRLSQLHDLAASQSAANRRGDASLPSADSSAVGQPPAPASEAIRAQPFASPDDLVDRCAEAVEQFTAGVPPQQVVLDLTPGTKDMTIALLRAARSGHRLVYLRHKRQNHRAVPFTEKLLTWPAEERSP